MIVFEIPHTTRSTGRGWECFACGLTGGNPSDIYDYDQRWAHEDGFAGQVLELPFEHPRVESYINWISEVEDSKTEAAEEIVREQSSVEPTDSEDPRGFRDLPITRQSLAAAIYHCDADFDNDRDDPDRYAEWMQAAAEEAWRFVCDAVSAARDKALAPVRALADELDALSDEHYAAYKHGDPRDARRASSYTEGFSVGLDHAAERIRAVVGED